MAPANLAGPAGPDLSPPRPADAAELRRRIGAGEWVVDLRDRIAFAAGHVPGAFSFPLDNGFATYLGWMIPWGTPLTLLGDSPEQVAQAQRELARIGIDRPAAAATGRPEAWAGERVSPRCGWSSSGILAAAIGAGNEGPVVLDVRRRLEWEAGHIAGAFTFRCMSCRPGSPSCRPRGVGALRERLPLRTGGVHPRRPRPERGQRQRRLRQRRGRRARRGAGLSIQAWFSEGCR